MAATFGYSIIYEDVSKTVNDLDACFLIGTSLVLPTGSIDDVFLICQ